jgi:methyl-accepting chemotaxis protein
MKKFLAIVAIAAFMTSCGEGNSSTEVKTDSSVVTNPSDSAKANELSDSASKMATEASHVADSANKMMDKAADKMDDAADKMKEGADKAKDAVK